MSLSYSLALLCALAACANGADVKEIPLAKEVPLPSASRLFALWPLGLGKQRVNTHGSIDGQIVGGSSAYTGQFPWQVSMQVSIPGYNPQHLCGGTLIDKQWVLTAAHCAYGVPASTTQVDVVLGITNLLNKGQRIQVTNMIVHASYDPNSNSGVGPYDICLLKLAKPASLSSLVKLAALPADNAIPTGSATLSGWGSTSSNGNSPVYPNQLQYINLPTVSFQQCYTYISRTSPNQPNPLAYTNVCTGPLDAAGKSSCSGDSGGPLVQLSGSQAVVIGIVSWGLADCGSFPYPSVYTRVSAYNTWIRAVQAQY